MVSVRHSITHLGSRDHSPLLKRGWVFQERLLSGRVLHSRTRVGVHVLHILRMRPRQDMDQDNEFSKFWFPGLFTEGNIIPWRHMWYNIVENYTALDFT